MDSFSFVSKLSLSPVQNNSFWNFTIHGERRYSWDENELSIGAHLSRLQSEFDYRNGQAELNLKGYAYGLDVGFSPQSMPKLLIDLGVSYAQLKGRDFVDHLTGTTGLTVEAKLKSLQYSIVPSYELYQYSSVDAQHAIRAHAGYVERDWEMNIGWFTNNKENLEVDQPWLFGLSYQWEQSIRENRDFVLNSRVDALDGGYRVGLDLSVDF